MGCSECVWKACYRSYEKNSALVDSMPLARGGHGVRRVRAPWALRSAPLRRRLGGCREELCERKREGMGKGPNRA